MNIPETALATLSSSGAEQPATDINPATVPPHSAGQLAIPIFEVAFGKGMWWSIPAEMSAALYQKYSNNEDAGYTFPWGNTTYSIDFLAWEWTVVGSNRRRSVRLVWVSPESVDPTWTEQIPP